MLKGIDVSNWQGSLNIDDLKDGGVEFVIAKATQGDWFVDAYCDDTVQKCIRAGLPFGFYHFGDARNSPETDAAYFINNCTNYFNEGIPVLDWEELYDDNVKVSDPSVAWVNDFVRTVHDQTGVWPWIYANPWRFNQGGVEPNCARWIASYPPVSRPGLDYDPGEPPETNGLVAAWQYASDGAVSGYVGNLDVNEFYGDTAAWNAYAGVTEQVPVESGSSILENGEYRVTIERK